MSGAPTDNNIMLWNAVIFGYLSFSDIYRKCLWVWYRPLSQSYEDCLGVREYIIMGIYWIISSCFCEIVFCECKIFGNDLKYYFLLIILRVQFKLMKIGILLDNPV